MAKQRFISFILLCAFAVLFAHSIVPHHHEEETFAHHQASHDNDNDDIDHDFLEQAFSHFQHEQGGTINYETASPDYSCSKVNFDKNTFLLVQHIVKVLHKPPIKHAKPSPIYFTSSYYYVNRLLKRSTFSIGITMPTH